MKRAELARPPEVRNRQVECMLRRHVSRHVIPAEDMKLQTVIGTEKSWLECFAQVADSSEDGLGVLSPPQFLSFTSGGIMCG